MENQQNATILPFKLPGGIMDGDADIASVFDDWMELLVKIQDVKANLAELEKQARLYHDDLLLKIDATGGEQWQRTPDKNGKKGIGTAIVKEWKIDWLKGYRAEFQEWVDENGLEDLWSIRGDSLGSAIMKRIMPEGTEKQEEIDKFIEDLPQFITRYKNKKLSMHHTTVTKYRKQFLNK